MGEGGQDNIERGGRNRLPGTTAGLVRLQLTSIQKEYLEVKADLGAAWETLEAGRNGLYSLREFLSRGGTDGASFRVRDMNHQVFDGEEERGGAKRFLATGDK